MDETEGDFDTIVRLKCLNFANDIAERATAAGNFLMCDPETLIACAETIEHYATNGGTVAFESSADARKFVRGE